MTDSPTTTTTTMLPDTYDEFAQAEIIKLQSAIKYVTEEDLVKARVLVEQLPDSNTDKYCNLGCISFKEKKFLDATESFNNCLQMERLMPGTGKLIGSKVMRERSTGETDNDDVPGSGGRGSAARKHRPDLLYNLAVCHFAQKHHSEALQFIAEIIEQGIRE